MAEGIYLPSQGRYMAISLAAEVIDYGVAKLLFNSNQQTKVPKVPPKHKVKAR